MSTDTTLRSTPRSTEENWTDPNAAKALAEAYPEKNMKVRKAPDFLIKIAGRFDGRMAQAAANLGHNADVDASKAERVMGFTYIPTTDALLASAAYITEHAS